MNDKSEIDRPEKHPRYYQHPVVVLQIENTLYRVDKSLLCKFQVFRDMFDGAAEFNHDQDEGQTDENPIRIQGVTIFEMDSVLDIIHHNYWVGPPAFNLEQWKAILHLSTLWDLQELRDCAVQVIKGLNPSPVDTILLAQKFQVLEWIKPAYLELCIQQDPITLDEANLLGLEVFHDISQIRERSRAQPNIVFPCNRCSGNGRWACNKCGGTCDSTSVYRCRKCNHGAAFYCDTCYWVNPPPLPPQPPSLAEVAKKVVDEFLKT